MILLKIRDDLLLDNALIRSKSRRLYPYLNYFKPFSQVFRERHIGMHRAYTCRREELCPVLLQQQFSLTIVSRYDLKAGRDGLEVPLSIRVVIAQYGIVISVSLCQVSCYH